MVIPLLTLVLVLMAAVFAMILVRGFITGRASTRSIRSVSRDADPAAFWFAQAFNGLLALACLFGAIIAVTGIG